MQMHVQVQVHVQVQMHMPHAQTSRKRRSSACVKSCTSST